MKRTLVTLVTLASIVLGACASTADGARIDAEVPPRGDAFRPVAQVLVDGCGALDCHGSKYRNMRLFGFGSARLASGHRPNTPETTPEEVEADYQAVVALEPELVRQVVADRGERAERLTLLRKARGTEAHRGGVRFEVGSDADTCIRSWLASNVDEAACKNAVPRLR